MLEFPKVKVTQDVAFIYEKRDGYAPLYCNGATGGMNPMGEIVVHFFNEHLRVPEREEIAIDVKTGVVVDGNTTGGGSAVLTRAVTTGVVMSIESAERISGWLAEVVKNARAMREGKV